MVALSRPVSGGSVRKLALLLAAAAIAVTPAAIAANKKPEEKKTTTFEKQSNNTLRLLKNGLPLILPSWALPLYFNMNKKGDAAKTTDHAKKKKM
jgi:hypothetical protein